MSGGIQSPQGTNRLSDRTIKAFIADAKGGKLLNKDGVKIKIPKLFDGGGMFLMLTPSGTPVWRLKYRLTVNDKASGVDVAKDQTHAIGTYPEISLAEARATRDAIRTMLREGRDPMVVKQVNKAAAALSSAQTFEEVGRSWLEMRQKNKNWSPIHYEKSLQALERDVFPQIGKIPVAAVTTPMVAAVMDKIAKRGVFDTVGKIYEQVRAIFRFAHARGMREDNPADSVRELLPSKKSGHMPALLDFASLGDVLRKAQMARLSPSVRMAHVVLAYTGARIGNVVNAEWSEFDLENEVPIWVIPRAKMKMQDRNHDHKIILGPTITAELRTWRQTSGGKGYLFPSPVTGKHVTREALEKVYRVTLSLAKIHAPHGWRSALSTLAKDNGYHRDVVELALDHIHDNEVVRAYDRGERLQQRIELMNWWDTQLAQAQRGADVVPLPRKVS